MPSVWFWILISCWAPMQPAGQPSPAPAATGELSVTVGKSLVIDSPAPIQRVSVANGATAEAVAVTPREVLINGKAAGETSLIIWPQGGKRLVFDLIVKPGTAKLDVVRRLIREEITRKDP
jgi:pilus assembly protein CpaC